MVSASENDIIIIIFLIIGISKASPRKWYKIFIGLTLAYIEKNVFHFPYIYHTPYRLYKKNIIKCMAHTIWLNNNNHKCLQHLSSSNEDMENRGNIQGKEKWK